MKKFIKLAALSFFALPGQPCMVMAGDMIRVKWTPAMREYCYVLRFPEGWNMPRTMLRRDGTLTVAPKMDISGDYEFRVPGLLTGSRFLVRGVMSIGETTVSWASNIYEADLSDPRGVARLTDEKSWNEATPIPLRHVGPVTELHEYIRSLGHRFDRTGDHLEISRVSPDRSVAVLQSWSGKLRPGSADVPLHFSIGFGRDHGKFFFDAYRLETGKKLVTVTANFSPWFPGMLFSKTGWVTERYFFIPLDEKRERCLICDFGRKR